MKESKHMSFHLTVDLFRWWFLDMWDTQELYGNLGAEAGKDNKD